MFLPPTHPVHRDVTRILSSGGLKPKGGSRRGTTDTWSPNRWPAEPVRLFLSRPLHDQTEIPVAAPGSVSPSTNVCPAAPPCPKSQLTKECGDGTGPDWGAPQRVYGTERRRNMNLVHFKRHRTPLMDGY